MLVVGLTLTLPALAQAATGSWVTDDGVGPNQVDFTLEITCPAVSFVCDLINGSTGEDHYSDTQTSNTTGAGTLEIDGPGEFIRFDSDSTQDVGSGPQPAYFTLTGTDMEFLLIPFAGVPEIENPVVFALTDPPIDVPGLAGLNPGDYAFAQTMSYSALADVVGDLEFILPGIVVPPDDVVLSGVLRVLGDVDQDGRTEYELRGVTGGFAYQVPSTIGGEPVTIQVTGQLSANLSGETPPAPPIPPVPALGPLGLVSLSLLLSIAGTAYLRVVRA
jgi:hypothetical protein